MFQVYKPSLIPLPITPGDPGVGRVLLISRGALGSLLGVGLLGQLYHASTAESLDSLGTPR